MLKIKLISGNKSRKCQLPYKGCEYVVPQGSCPECGEEEFKVQGTEQRISKDDRAYESDAVAACCGRGVGLLRVETNTLFGVREDEAVLVHGRARVY